MDFQIAVCSLEVLVTFSDNFDYQACPRQTCDQNLGVRGHGATCRVCQHTCVLMQSV